MNESIKRFINTLRRNIKIRPYTYLLWGTLTIIVVPIIIWLLYFIGDCGYVLLNISLSSGDALGFYGAFLSFIGTVVLGAIALWQMKNRKLN